MKRATLLLLALAGFICMQAQVRFAWVDPVNAVFTLKNFGTDTVDVSAYRLCSEFRYAPGPLSALTIESGSLNLAPGETVKISGFSLDATAADFGLYLPSGPFGNAANMVDFLQWGSGGNGRESVAVAKGIWTAGEFLAGNAPYTYTGDGTQNGAAFWQASPAYMAKLSGSQEVLPVMSPGWGMVYADMEGDSLWVWGSFWGLKGEFDPTVAGGSHIHSGLAGQNGGIALTLVPTLDSDLKGGTFEKANNGFELTAEQKTALMNRGMYVNIHTTAHRSGELRGQILPFSDASYMANLFGGNEVPSIMTTAHGALALDLRGDTLTITGSFSNMEGRFNSSIGATGAHLHIGRAGEIGGVSVFLNATTTDSITGTFEAANNRVALTAEQKALLQARNLYANLHSTLFPSGELRGQVGPVARARFRVNLSGANEVPPVLTAATGELLVELLDSNLVVSGSFQNLGSELNRDIAGGAHIHMGITGENGGVAVLLSTTTDTTSQSGWFAAENNSFEVDSALMAALMQRKLYVNIHSLGNPSGELRGQLLPEGMFVLNGFLSGTNEAPPVLTAAHGAVKAEVLGDKLWVTGSFDGLGSDLNTAIAGGAHLHLAPAGSNGPVAMPLSVTIKDGNRGGYFEAANNNFTISSGMLDTLRARYGYVNIHSMDNAPGELRGQLLHEATAYFAAPLSGTSEVPPVRTSATGAVVAEYVGGKLWVSGSFSGLESDFNADIAGGAHIHNGLAGQNGAPEFFLSPVIADGNRAGKFQAKSNVFEVSEGQRDTLFNRMYYVNIHSGDVPSGEIRGNLLPQATAYFTSSLAGKNEVQPVQSTGIGAVKAELRGSELVLTGAFSGLSGQYDANIAGGSHLHTGLPGNNGGIAVFLVPDLTDTTLKSGTYMADSNTFMLDEAALSELMSGQWYFNLHSTTEPSGELRGQILPESNFYPSDEAVITTPPDGAAVEIAGNPDSLFMATWSPASDPNGNTLAYHWQVALDPGFNIIVQDLNVGQSTVFAITFAQIDTFLMDAGVGIGDTLTLFHRAVATDGSVCTNGAGASVSLVRGVLTDIDPDLLDEFRFKLYPSPVTEQATLEVYAPLATPVELRVLDMLGREVHSQQLFLTQGSRQLELDFQPYRAGIYMIQLMAEGQFLQTLKVVKQ